MPRAHLEPHRPSALGAPGTGLAHLEATDGRTLHHCLRGNIYTCSRVMMTYCVAKRSSMGHAIDGLMNINRHDEMTNIITNSRGNNKHFCDEINLEFWQMCHMLHHNWGHANGLSRAHIACCAVPHM